MIRKALLVAVVASLQAPNTCAQERGRELVEEICSSCHRTSFIDRSSGYTKEGWSELIATMIDLSDAPETKEEITSYLAKAFPPNERRASMLIDGPMEIEFVNWTTPTLGQRSRDPVEAPDGRIWWVGQHGNILGVIDPETGAMKEYPLPDMAMPHSVNIDGDGNPWYMGNKNGTVGKLDLATDKITEFKMPDPKARDPHTGIFDADGILWFTLQHSNMIGRLDPSTGDVKLVTAPTPRSRPYGIKLDAKGNIWVACNGSNCLLELDKDTMTLTEHKLPLEGTTVRRLDIASDGMIWYVNSRLGRLGRFDPVKREAKEWPSPSGPKSHPYALAIIDDIVWYNESGVRPDPLVRFDPKTESFQSWPIPTGNIYVGIARHIRKTADGNLLIHQSASNQIILVKIPKD